MLYVCLTDAMHQAKPRVVIAYDAIENLGRIEGEGEATRTKGNLGVVNGRTRSEESGNRLKKKRHAGDLLIVSHDIMLRVPLEKYPRNRNEDQF